MNMVSSYLENYKHQLNDLVSLFVVCKPTWVSRSCVIHKTLSFVEKLSISRYCSVVTMFRRDELYIVTNKITKFCLL